MKAGRTAVALALIIAMAGAVSVHPAEETEAAGTFEVWFYSQDGTALFFKRTAEKGDTLADVLAGDLPAVVYWFDMATGYEWHQDKAFTKETYLRASVTRPPQEPAGDPEDGAYNDIIYLAVGGGIILAGIIIIGRRFT